jgi:hypothetical protein
VELVVVHLHDSAFEPVLSAFLCQLDYQFLLLLIPLVFSCKGKRMQFLLRFSIATAALSTMNCLAFGKEAIFTNFMQWAKVDDVTPNIGIQWYLFQECLSEYIPFFNWISFKFISICCCLLIYNKLKANADNLMFLLCFAVSISLFNAYPSIGYYFLMMKLISDQTDLLQKCRFILFSNLSFCYR